MTPERFHRLRAALTRRQPDLTVLTDYVHKSHNLSAILRSCEAVGVLEAHIVSPERSLYLHHTSSAGAKKWLSVDRHRSVEDAVGHLRARGFAILAAHPAPGARDYRDVDYTLPTALTMGAELHGLSDEALALADAHITIPMMGMVGSLNVSVASAILLFEAMRQRAAAGMYDTCRIPAPEFEERLFAWAYPKLARRMRDEGRPYPTLDEDGQIVRE